MRLNKLGMLVLGSVWSFGGLIIRCEPLVTAGLIIFGIGISLETIK